MKIEKPPVLSEDDLIGNFYDKATFFESLSDEALAGLREVAQAQRDDTWQKAQGIYEPLIQQAKAEVAVRFQKAVRDLRDKKDIDLTEREFEIFFSIRNVGLLEGYNSGKEETAREIFKEIESIGTIRLLNTEEFLSLKSKYEGGK